MFRITLVTLLATLSLPAHAELPFASGMIYLFTSSSCSGDPQALIPAGSANVNCAALPRRRDDVVYSLRIVGDSTCVPIQGMWMNDICKAYNGK